jgi:hypothetical protein
MKNPVAGMWVTHYGRHGVIETIGVAGYALVRFPSSDGFPFPSQEVVRVNELKKYKKKGVDTSDHEPAPF